MLKFTIIRISAMMGISAFDKDNFVVIQWKLKFSSEGFKSIHNRQFCMNFQLCISIISHTQAGWARFKLINRNVYIDKSIVCKTNPDSLHVCVYTIFVNANLGRT